MTIITDAMLRHYNDLTARAEAQTLQDVITRKEARNRDDAFEAERIIKTAERDLVYDVTAGWVFWPEQDEPRGYWTAEALHVIADELDHRNKELFGD